MLRNHLKHTFFTPSSPNEYDPQSYSKIINFAKEHRGCVAVFDADGTLWSQDAELAFFRWFFSQHKYVSTEYNENSYRDYEIKAKSNGLEAYKWLLKSLAGIPESDIQKMVSDFMREYFSVYIYPQQKNLITDLKNFGIDVWIVSASNQWLVKEGAKYVGIDPHHVAGIRMEVKNKIITENILEPFPYRDGKVLAINEFIGKTPMIVFGDSGGDIAMLKESKGLSVYITHNQNQNDEGVKLAKECNWILQYFPLTTPIQFDKKIEHNFANQNTF